MAEWSITKQSACELIRLKRSGLVADGEDNKPTDDVNCRGPASWPGYDLLFFTCPRCFVSVVTNIINLCNAFVGAYPLFLLTRRQDGRNLGISRRRSVTDRKI